MLKETGTKWSELNIHTSEYQTLFELVPCLITLQDKEFRLIRYNHLFEDHFHPEPGDYCYQAYKKRDSRCEKCLVAMTFDDGKSHYGEESSLNNDGTFTYWIAHTSPVKNEKNEIIAVMEVCLDITHRKELEENLIKSEKKYYSIFNNIPNPLFVLDINSLNILDCNERVTSVYGFLKEEINNKSFMDLFIKKEKIDYTFKMKAYSKLNRVKQLTKSGETIIVNIGITPSEYPGQKVLLVVTDDITKRLEVEQQIIQAGKMATLGEMATGIAHELNQPLSVIKTVSSFFIRKINDNESIDQTTLNNMLVKVDNNVDRASRIINHLRNFARKSEIDFEKVQVNEELERAFSIFAQHLRVRGIEVLWDTDKSLPMIMADPQRLEQVFINLLINARDAIEEKYRNMNSAEAEKKIHLKTYMDNNNVVIEVSDTGAGIPEAISDKIFEPFFTTKEAGKGTGLGLSISYGIIKDFGGTIYSRSIEDQGACFIITLPVQDNKNG
ncbi:MAG: PAS domain S-box protein [Proteobacteria bacterium]|nr:PAS domain S-box protein [Pseudomonadota bacterium]